MTDRSYRQPWEPGPPSPYSDDHPSFLLGVALHALKAIAASEHVFDTPQQYAAWVVANIEMTSG
ncbi:MAG TPA: hypothetical protein VM782_01280 [Stellaceae bacterium]|nr:hypothetical protein [Stellaceae bacterium]